MASFDPSIEVTAEGNGWCFRKIGREVRPCSGRVEDLRLKAVAEQESELNTHPQSPSRSGSHQLQALQPSLTHTFVHVSSPGSTVACGHG